MKPFKLIKYLAMGLIFCVFVIGMADPLDVITGYSTIHKDTLGSLTIHGMACSLGLLLILGGYGGFLGRGFNITVYLFQKKDLNQIREWVIELLVYGISGIVGIAIFYHFHVFRYI